MVSPVLQYDATVSLLGAIRFGMAEWVHGLQTIEHFYGKFKYFLRMFSQCHCRIKNMTVFILSNCFYPPQYAKILCSRCFGGQTPPLLWVIKGK